MRRALALVLPILCALLAACATQGKTRRALDQTLLDYATAVRWGGFEQALAFVDPAELAAHPPSRLDLERYRQVRVSYYHDQPVQITGENEAHKLVEIGIVNEHTLGERRLLDHQTWRWDAKAQRWWLTSGLPDITRHD